jgi:hypothetical protein
MIIIIVLKPDSGVIFQEGQYKIKMIIIKVFKLNSRVDPF